MKKNKQPINNSKHIKKQWRHHLSASLRNVMIVIIVFSVTIILATTSRDAFIVSGSYSDKTYINKA